MHSFPALLVVLLNFLSIQAEALANEARPIDSNEKVKVELYYETLCPGCSALIATEYNTTVSQLYDHLELLLVPYGNAKVVNGVAVCQHGVDECYGSKMHGCLLVQEGGLTLEALHFIACMEDFDARVSMETRADKCGKEMNMDPTPLKICAKSKVGDYIFKLNGKVTENARPSDFYYTPYSVANGKVINPMLPFKPQVCAAFQNPPPECSG